MTRPPEPRGEIRLQKDGEWELRCPQCGRWGGIDDDQLHGRISTDHTHTDHSGTLICTFHETRNWFVTAIRLEDEK